MNIFVLDKNPKTCAKYHNNKHVVKMILETSQLLCSVHWLNGVEAPYKLTHKNHPCSIWVRKSIDNYNWLCKLGIELCKEYTYRYGKTHKTEEVLKWCIKNKPTLPKIGLTEFALAMPDECKIGDVVESYRCYYRTHKKDISSWKRRYKPRWFITP